jgi:hypothetical protein
LNPPRSCSSSAANDTDAASSLASPPPPRAALSLRAPSRTKAQHARTVKPAMELLLLLLLLATKVMPARPCWLAFAAAAASSSLNVVEG